MTINGLVLKGGVYREISLKGGAAICVPGMNFTLNGNVSFIQNSAKEGAGGAVFLSSGSLTFMGNVVFNGNSALSGAGGAVYCGSGSVNFDSYVIAESNESSFGGAVCSSSIVLNDGGYFVDNKAKLGGAIFLSGGISTITAKTKDVLFSGNTMQKELNTAYIRNDIYMEGLNNLTFDAASSRTITLNGGIVCDTNTSVVNKIGQGTLVFNGDFYLRAFYVYNGVLHFGTGSSFYGDNVYFSSGVFIDMRNKSSNELRFQNLTSSASLYYDIDLYNKFPNIIIVENRAQMAGSKVKAALSGVSGGSVTYNVIRATTSGSGNIIFDNTNAEGSHMTRVHWAIDYGAGGSQDSWHEVNLTLQADQLSSIDGLPDNERSTAFALDSDYGASTGDFFFIIDTIDKMGNIVSKKEALNDLSGYIYANAITVPTLNAVRNNILSRLERNYFSNDDALTKRNIWWHWYSANNLYEGDNNSMGDFKSSRNGFQAGFDTLKEDSHIFGITVGSINSKSTQNDDKVDINGYNAGCYGSYFFDNNLETRVLLIGGREKYTSARNIKYLNRKTSADFTGYSVNASAELAYNYYYSDKLCLKPFIGFDYGYVHIDDFVEKGADAADLNVFSNSYNKAGIVLGFQVNNGIESKFKWYAELKTDLLLYGRYGEIQQKMKNGIQSMSIKGIENDIFNAVFGLGIIYDVTKSLSVYSNINTVIPDTQRGFYCNIGANFKFNIIQKDFYEKTSHTLVK